eukprot:TRINITY_DN17030_c0_g1_i1.p1 TRINITY_DN17030_c0_g1~~TRINITY_DN17030_c0_g1_i1.p1  ORF type:complete len:983 (+),score=212.92 TRINITY_DN17030_c0_g1_i1:29-2977(+)
MESDADEAASLPRSDGDNVHLQARGSGSDAAVQVYARVRPLRGKEIERSESCCLRTFSSAAPEEGEPPRVTVAAARGSSERTFEVDRVFGPAGPEDTDQALQASLSSELGVRIAEDVLSGFHSCLLACGPPGSGKTHALLGTGAAAGVGLIPSFADALFAYGRPEPVCSATYVEVCGHHVRDLLLPPCEEPEELCVRHFDGIGLHPHGLVEMPVFNGEDLRRIIELGGKSRAFGLPSLSSRSGKPHCVLTVHVTSFLADGDVVDVAQELRARATFVDLGRSARGQLLGRCASGRDAASDVGALIAELVSPPAADAGDFAAGECAASIEVQEPWFRVLLQDPLGGNSKLYALAALSPADSEYSGTIRTLGIASSLRDAAMHPVQNLDAAGRLANQLRTELERCQVKPDDEEAARSTAMALEDLLSRYEPDADERLQLRWAIEDRWQRGSRALGLGVNADLDAGEKSPEDTRSMGRDEASLPRLVSFSEDPALCGRLVYFIPEGSALDVGSASECVPLGGLGMSPVSATLHNDEGRILMHVAPGARVLLNGVQPEKPSVELGHGDALLFGFCRGFHLVVPSSMSPIVPERHLDVVREGAPETHGATLLGGSASANASDLWSGASLQVKPESSLAYRSASNFAEDLHARVGIEAAEAFLAGLRSLAQRIDEANAILAAGWPQDSATFSAAALVDFSDASGTGAECVVRFHRPCGDVPVDSSSPPRPWSSTSATSLSQVAQGDPLNEGLDEGIDGQVGRPVATRTTLSQDEFLAQLEDLREAYDSLQRGDSRCRWYIDLPSDHPEETHPVAAEQEVVQNMTSEQMYELERKDWQEAMRLKDLRICDLEQSLAQGPDETRRLMELEEQHERDRAAWEETIHSKDLRLQELEQQQEYDSQARQQMHARLQELEQQVAAFSALSAAAQTASGSEGSAPQRSTAAAAPSAQLARRLLADLQDLTLQVHTQRVETRSSARRLLNRAWGPHG